MRAEQLVSQCTLHELTADAFFPSVQTTLRELYGHVYLHKDDEGPSILFSQGNVLYIIFLDEVYTPISPKTYLGPVVSLSAMFSFFSAHNELQPIGSVPASSDWSVRLHS